MKEYSLFEDSLKYERATIGYADYGKDTYVYRDKNDKLLTGIVISYGKRMIIKNGKIHNENGPAVTYDNSNSTAYYLDGNIIGANLTAKTFEKLKNIYYKELVFK